MPGYKSVNVTLRDSTMESFLDTSCSNLGETNMADRSRCRRGTLVLVIRDKSGSETSSCPMRVRDWTGLPGRTMAATRGEPQKEVKDGMV